LKLLHKLDRVGLHVTAIELRDERHTLSAASKNLILTQTKYELRKPFTNIWKHFYPAFKIYHIIWRLKQKF